MLTMKMTPRQSWAIFCATKIDVRDTAMDQTHASVILGELQAGGTRFARAIETLTVMPGAKVKGSAKPKQDWQALYDKAHAAGMAAGESNTPTPMVVAQHANPLDDKSPVEKAYFVSEGACGFAWITVHPGNCSFAVWLRKQGLARKAYHGGMEIWVHQFNQSISRKEAYADAFAKVLTEAGIKAYSGSRLD